MTGNGDRLSRIEAILEALAQRSVEADQRLTRIEQAQERNQQQFSEANERLTRIEQAIDETRKIADSNARAIQAWSLTIETDRTEREEADSELRVDINAIQQTLSQTAELQQTLLNVQLRDRDEWRQQRAEVNQQIQSLIDNQNQDRQNLRQQQEQARQQREQLNRTVQATQQQIQSLVANQDRDHQEARQQREEAKQRSAHIDQQIQALIDLSRQNTQAHSEFRADIKRLSDRLAG